MAAADKTLLLQVVSPDRVFYEGEATFVEMTTSEGDIGVYPGHIPLTSVIEPGVLSITEPDNTVRYAAIHDGFVEILPDRITVMAETAEWPDEIDINRANEAKIRAERRLGEKNSQTDTQKAEIALRRALTRLDASSRE